MFTQTQQRRQRNAFFQLSSFVSNADFNIKHVQFLIKLSQFLQQRYRNGVSHSVSASLLLTLGRLLPAQLQISSYKSIVFYESIIFQFRYYTCSLCLFLSFESNSLPVIAVKERYIKNLQVKVKILAIQYWAKSSLIYKLVFIYLVSIVKSLYFDYHCT